MPLRSFAVCLYSLSPTLCLAVCIEYMSKYVWDAVNAWSRYDPGTFPFKSYQTGLQPTEWLGSRFDNPLQLTSLVILLQIHRIIFTNNSITLMDHNPFREPQGRQAFQKKIHIIHGIRRFISVQKTPTFHPADRCIKFTWTRNLFKGHVNTPIFEFTSRSPKWSHCFHNKTL
jgi:hypothetical protein